MPEYLIKEIIERYEAKYAGFPIVDSTLSPNVYDCSGLTTLGNISKPNNIGITKSKNSNNPSKETEKPAKTFIFNNLIHDFSFLKTELETIINNNQ